MTEEIDSTSTTTAQAILDLQSEIEEIKDLVNDLDTFGHLDQAAQLTARAAVEALQGQDPTALLKQAAAALGKAAASTADRAVRYLCQSWDSALGDLLGIEDQPDDLYADLIAAR